MSLFQINEWWSANQTESNEECGYGCLCVANINNASDGLDKVILGSYNGILHIYAPVKVSAGLHDCLLEASLEGPILQVTAGRFMPLNQDIHLAVLHPNMLVVYKFTTNVGEQDVGLSMEKIYQHKLERSAANMVGGPFGGVKDKDFLCVQSLDGAISVFEQETYAFTRFLPGFLLPGPLAYTPHTDSFFTVSSNHSLEAYSYQVLAVATTSKADDDNEEKQGGKKIEADWSCVLGENAMDIQVVHFNKKKTMIIVLGEHSLFCFDTGGKLEFMKKFEDPLACIRSYPSNEGSIPITIACTHSKQLLIYDGPTLIWAAKLEDVAVAVERGNFSGSAGMIVIATDNCHISCNYLGTSPTVFSLPRSKQRDLSMEKVDRELNETKQKIAQHLAVSGDEIEEKSVKQDLVVSLNIPKTIDKMSVATNRVSVAQEFPSITFQITLKITRRINDVQVLIPIEKPLHSTLTGHCSPSLYDVEHPAALTTSIYLVEKRTPSTLDLKILVSYKKTNGTPQVLTSHVRLPLSLVAYPCVPVKKLNHKVTLDTNMQCVSLLKLLPDFESDQNNMNCIGMSYMDGCKATVLTSKSSNRYRVQSDEIDHLWLVTQELVERLKQHHPDIQITLTDPPKLEEFVPFIDEHFKMRKVVADMRILLEQRAHQHRIIQKRLLTRFKDKTPQPLLGLDTLLLGTHTQILALVDAMEKNDTLLRHSSSRLSSALQYLVLLIALWRSFSPEEEERLREVLAINATYSNSLAVGWEEMVDVGLTALLKTTLSRGEGDNLLMSSPTILQPPADTVKLKKHIAIVMDRLAKGSKIIGAKEASVRNASREKTVSNLAENMFSPTKPSLDRPPDGLRAPPKSKFQTTIKEEDEDDVIAHEKKSSKNEKESPKQKKKSRVSKSPTLNLDSDGIESPMIGDDANFFS